MQLDRGGQIGVAARPLAVESRWTQAGCAKSDELAAARSEEAAARRDDWWSTSVHGENRWFTEEVCLGPHWENLISYLLKDLLKLLLVS